MAKIAPLNSKLVLDTSDFTTGLGRALKKTGQFGKKLGRTTLKVAKYGAGLSAVAGGGLALLTAGQSRTIAQLTKLSERTGVSTETLAGLNVAAGRAGIELDNLGDIVKEIQLRLGEAKEAGGEAAEGFQMLGVNIDRLLQMRPDKRLIVLADAMKQVQGQSRRLAIADMIAGDQGSFFLNFLQQGGDAIRQATRDADQMGLTFSRVEGEQVRAMRRSFKGLKGLLKGVGTQLAIEVAPFITAATNKLVEMGTRGEGVGAKVVTAVEGITVGIAKTSDTLNLVKAGWFGLKAAGLTAIRALISPVTLLGRGIEKLAKVVGIDAVEQFAAFGRKADEKLAEMARSAAKASKKAFRSFESGENAKAVRGFFDDIRQRAEQRARAIANASRAEQDQALAASRTAAQLERQQRAAQKRREEMERMQQLQSDRQNFLQRFVGFGLEGLERRMAELRASRRRMVERARELGFGRAVIDKINEEFDQRVRKARERFKTEDRRAPGGGGPGTQGAPDLVRAGSARAQQLAFSGEAFRKDQVPKKQLQEQQKSRKLLAQIVDKISQPPAEFEI